MEREPQGGSDFGQDLARDAGEEPGALRDAAPDLRAPIDESAPVSGHVVGPASSGSIAETPEHDWSAAERIIFPALRPVGTQGLTATDVSAEALAADATTRQHSQPIVDEGPCGIPRRLRAPRRRLRHHRQRRPRPLVGRDRRAAPGRGAPQPRRVVGRRRLDRRGLGRAAADLVRHRRGLGRVADPPARGHRPPVPGARLRRTGPRRDPGAAPARRRQPPARATATSRRCSPSSSSSSRAAPTSRSTGACSSCRTGGSSSSRRRRHPPDARGGPPRRDRRRGRDRHARPPGRPQRADDPAERGADRRVRRARRRRRRSGRSS